MGAVAMIRYAVEGLGLALLFLPITGLWAVWAFG